MIWCCAPIESEQTRIAALSSCSGRVGEKAVALRYAMERKQITNDDGTIIETGGIVWKGEVEGVTAESVLSGKHDSETRSALEEAKGWLEAYLTKGGVAADVVVKKAGTMGFSERTLRRAREALGIKPDKDGFGENGEWTWRLPQKGTPGDSPKGGQPSPKGGQPSNLGHLSKNIGENGQKPQQNSKDGQGLSDGHLSNPLGHLSEPSTSADHTQGDEPEVVIPVCGEDARGLFPEDEADPWS